MDFLFHRAKQIHSEFARSRQKRATHLLIFMTSEEIRLVSQWLNRRVEVFSDPEKLQSFMPDDCSVEFIEGAQWAFKLLRYEAGHEINYPT